ncbi:type VI immunity family protein [uncultured Marinobacter sp.]|uniref:type VI immunity family protein n=1 Tax=uncultured Marinobacter sp. TaxID=187379 RepID=UPI002619A94A|nr:type VI immunity family protein [uncultured Marinobacter sp.]
MDELKQLMTIEDADGVMLKLSLNVEIYFRNAWQVEQRAALLSVFDEYRAYFGADFKWTTNPNTGRWKSLKKTPYPYPEEWLPGVPQDEAWEFVYHGGGRKTDASDIDVVSFGRGEVDGHESPASMDSYLSYIYMHFPIDFFMNRDEKLPAVFQRWCSLLNAEQAYAGFGLAISHGYETRVDPLVFPLGERFAGLNISDDIGHSRELLKSIKTPNWLTAICQPYVDQLGGEAALREKLPNEWLTTYTGGLIVQAGDKPLLGDREQGLDVPAYRQAAQVLRPIRSTDHDGIAMGRVDKKQVYNAPEYQAWLARFDGEASND